MYILPHMMSSSSRRPRRAASARTVPDSTTGSQSSRMTLSVARPVSAPADIDAKLGFLKEGSQDSEDENKEESNDKCNKVIRTHKINHELQTYVPVSYKSGTQDEAGPVIKRTYDKDDGTPHGCITTLIGYVINALDNLPKGPPRKIKKTTSPRSSTTASGNDYYKEQLERFLPLLDIRSKISTYGTEIQVSLESALKAIYTNSMNNYEKNILITEFWAAILNKSISDVSQCGALVNNIQYLKNTSSSSSSSSNVKTRLQESPTTAFLSSDGIAAAVSSLVLREINHPIPTLCSRKAHHIGQTIILQKSEISALAVMLKCAGNQHKNEFAELLSYYRDKVIHQTHVDLSDIIKLYTDIIQKIPDLCKELQHEHNEFYNEHMVNDFIQQKIDYIFSPDGLINIDTRSQYQSCFCRFISNIIKMDKRDETNDTLIKFANILKQIAEVDDDNSKYIMIPRWTYHISSDMFKYMFSNHDDYKPEDETKVGRAEIIAATYDATYGHDYHDISRTDMEKTRHSVIQKLGEDFLTIMGESPPVLSSTREKVKNEDQCIESVLDTTNFSSINQVGSKFEVSFCSRNNHLKIKPEMLKLKDTEINWKIGESACIFPKNHFIASIDFVRGEPSVAPLRAAQKNMSMDYAQKEAVTKVDVFEFIQNNENNSQLDNFKDLVRTDTRFRELKMAPHHYDCAGSYNGFPVVVPGLNERQSRTTHISECELSHGIKLSIITTMSKIDEETIWSGKAIETMKYRPGFHSKDLLRYMKTKHESMLYLKDIPTDDNEIDQVKESFSNLLNSIWKATVLTSNISSILDDIEAVYIRLGWGRPSRNTEVDNASRLIAKKIAQTFRKNKDININVLTSYIQPVRDIIERNAPQDLKPVTDNDCPSPVTSAEAIGNVIIYVIEKLQSETVSEDEKMLLSDMLSTAMNISIEGEASGRSLRFIVDSPNSGPAKKQAAGLKPTIDFDEIERAHTLAQSFHNMNQVDLRPVRAQNPRILSRGASRGAIDVHNESQPAQPTMYDSPIQSGNIPKFVPSSEPRTSSRGAMDVYNEGQSAVYDSPIQLGNNPSYVPSSDPRTSSRSSIFNPSEVENPAIMDASDSDSNNVPSSAEMGNSEDEMATSPKSENSLENYMDEDRYGQKDDDEISHFSELSEIIPLPPVRPTATAPITTAPIATAPIATAPAPTATAPPLRTFGTKSNNSTRPTSEWDSMFAPSDKSGFQRNPRKGGGTRKLRHKYKRKNTHRKPVQRKHKRTQRTTSNKNNKRTRRRR